MSGQRLRAAADLLRKRAKRCEDNWPAPWRYERGEVLHSGDTDTYVHDRPFFTNCDGTYGDEYVAMMDPWVALALADWLDAEILASGLEWRAWAAESGVPHADAEEHHYRGHPALVLADRILADVEAGDPR